MKREILFRGKQVDTNNWVEGSLILLKRLCGIGYYINQISSILCQLPVDFETVGKFTGLTDKSGKRIFEGDIMKSWLIDHSREWIHVVEWRDLSWHFKCTWASDRITMFSATMLHSKNCFEVIGNIHDNPELLNISENSLKGTEIQPE